MGVVGISAAGRGRIAAVYDVRHPICAHAGNQRLYAFPGGGNVGPSEPGS